MKQLYLLLMLFALFSLEGCKDDGEMSFPASSSPEIVVERNDLYSNPNRKFIIKADLKDDLGLKSLKSAFLSSIWIRKLLFLRMIC